MTGLPIDMRPDFPSDAHTVLLTEEAGFDPDLISKPDHLEHSGNIMITTGLLQQLQRQGTQTNR